MTGFKITIGFLILNMFVMDVIAVFRLAKGNKKWKRELTTMSGFQLNFRYLSRPMKIWFVLSSLVGIVVAILLYFLR
jgi:hypothetical protein